MLRCHITTWIKELSGASYGGGHQSIIIQDSCLDRESENQKKIEFQIFTSLSQFPLTKLISFILK